MQKYRIKSLYDNKMCNICLGIFSPFKFELKEYLGYDISIFRDNCRFLEVLVNRGGSPGGVIALYFDGDVNFFKELPRPCTPELESIYNSIKRKRGITMFIRSSLIKRIYNKGSYLLSRFRE